MSKPSKRGKAVSRAGKDKTKSASTPRPPAPGGDMSEKPEDLLTRAREMQRQGRHDEAVACFREALSLQPSDAPTHFHLGNALREARRWDEAAAAYRRALEIEPAFASACNNLGTVLREQRRPEQAAECYRRALAIKPDYAVAYNNLGMALRDLGQFEAAEENHRKALAIEPNHAGAHYGLGKALHELRRYDEAMASYRRALALAPAFPEARAGLADTLQQIGQVRASIAEYRRALELRPDNEKVLSNLLFVHNYLADLPPAVMLSEARRFGELVLSRASPFQDWDNPPLPERRLRVGFVSGDLLNHPVGFFLESTLAALDPNKLTLYAYSNHSLEDALTLRIKPYFSAWRAAHELDDAGLARRIRDDGIDILVDLAGHTARNRLAVFAWKPAPVQVSWLGYFATTGVPGMDYFLGDANVCPVEEEAHFSESIWRLPDAYYCYTPPFVNLSPSPPPCLNQGRVTFGCFNKLAKMNDEVVATWARILAQVGDARLFLKTAELGDAEQHRAVLVRFAAHGIGAERLVFEGAAPRHDYLAAFDRVDIALDPFPYNGGATTADGLWMGVPCLTPRGDRHIGHQGETLLRNVGLPEWVAVDLDDYVAKAVDFARDPARLAELRAGLRARLLASPLCDAPRFARNFEQALRGMWRAWCVGRTPIADAPRENTPNDDAREDTPPEPARPDAEARLQYALAQQQAGRLAEAEQGYRALIAELPGHAGALGHLALALCQMGRIGEAMPFFERSLEADPENPEIHLYRGIAHKEMGDFAAAAVSYRRAATLRPDDDLAHYYLGNALRELGQAGDAVASYERALSLNPDLFQAHNNLANIRQDLGQYEAAAASARGALAINPNYPIAHNNLGNSYKELGRLEDAVASYRAAIALAPEYHEAHNNLGVALQALTRYDEALASFRRALEIRPDFPEAHVNLGNTLQDIGRLGAGIEAYRAALALRPDDLEARGNLLFSLNYLAGESPARMLEEARRYGEFAAARAKPYTAWKGSGDPGRRLRVGLVSGDLRDHPVGIFLESTLAHLATDQVELFAYATVARESELTARLKPRFSAWALVQGMDDAALARRIHDDAIDILIDLAGHTAHNRLPVFAWKPAPVQVSWLGYFATTGVPGVDYFLADPHMVPPGEENHFSETVWRLPEIYYCFTPPADAIPQPARPAPAPGRITFGCFNRLAKLNEDVLALWAEILAALPEAQLFLKTRELGEPAQREALLARFVAQGIGPEQLILEGHSPRGEYLAAYNRVDLALDPFPYPGGTTTAEALWMGAPVLTLSGDRFIGHQGETLLRNCGLGEWIAEDKRDYVAKAVAFANAPMSAEPREVARRRFLASPLCDAPRFARHLEAALREMWTRHLASG